MSKRNQAVTAAMVMGNSVDWDKIDLQVVIDAVNQGKLGPALTEWLVKKGWLPPCPPPLTIDRSIPVHELGPKWPVWLGPVDGEGLKGEPDQDHRSVLIEEFNATKSVIITGLVGDEVYITGEERRLRIRLGEITPIDFHTGWNLFVENGQKNLKWLHEFYGISWIETDTVLRGTDGNRFSLNLCRRDDNGHWDCLCLRLFISRKAVNPALGLTGTKS